MASNTQDNANLTQGAPTVAVGQSLKTARELMGKDIGAVAVQLRIRQPFLQALEDGRHKDLPGGTYAVGFLRTYAEFLGLDGEEMVRRFRAEAAGELDARSELIFPSPVSEGRIPGGAVLFLGLLLAGVAYGAWYWLSSRETSVAEMVPPLPERLASVFNRPAALTGEAAKSAEPAAKPDEAPAKAEEPPAPTPAAAGKENEVVPPAEAEDDAKHAPQPAPAAPTPQAIPAALPPAAQAPAPAAPAAVAPAPEAAKVEAAKPAPAKPEQTKVEATKPAETAAPQPEAKPAEPAATPAAAPAPPPEGKVIGQDHADSRIQLKANGDDCWVQVRELDGQLLLSRLLRRGDSYMVPNRPGLTLMVGNAGALDVTVDGKKAPSLGNTGQVRRDIKLEPEKLLSGG